MKTFQRLVFQRTILLSKFLLELFVNYRNLISDNVLTYYKCVSISEICASHAMLLNKILTDSLLNV